MTGQEETAEVAIDAVNKMIDGIFKTAVIFLRVLNLLEQ
jgi:hypothetical protein